MVKHGGEWGTVCDDGFGVTEALSACHTLGFSGAKITAALESGHSMSMFKDLSQLFQSDYSSYTPPDTPSDNSILMDDVSCATNTTNFLTCSHRGWGVENCGHDEDVLLTCT